MSGGAALPRVISDEMPGGSWVRWARWAWSVRFRGAGLSDALIERMEAWEDSYYAALTDDIKWRSAEELKRCDAEGMELAHELAVAIGPDFEVEYRSFADRKIITQLHAKRPASNPAAQKAFSARANMGRVERAEAQALRSAAPKTRWSAQGPSGEVFHPR